MIDLSGAHVLVTGGSRGIGAACCRVFAAAGATLCVHFGRSKDRAEGVLDSLVGDGHFGAQADLSSEDAVLQLFEQIGDRWKRLDCLVNNAGVWLPLPLEESTASRLEESWALNLKAPFLIVRAALPLLRAATDPSIVNITSTAGQRGEAHYSQYAASKGGLGSATKSWAVELAPQIRVNAVAPGWVDTEMCREPFADGRREQIEQGIPRGKVASPEEIAGPVLFLASSLARHVTGEILNVNGGAVLCG